MKMRQKQEWKVKLKYTSLHELSILLYFISIWSKEFTSQDLFPHRSLHFPACSWFLQLSGFYPKLLNFIPWEISIHCMQWSCTHYQSFSHIFWNRIRFKSLFAFGRWIGRYFWGFSTAWQWFFCAVPNLTKFTRSQCHLFWGTGLS